MRAGIPWRAVLIGLLLLPVNAFWLVQMEMSSGGLALSTWALGPYPTTFSLFANVICFLVLLLVANAVVGRWRPQWALSQAELLIIYSMLAIGTSLTSVDFLDVLIPMLGHPTRHATPYNRWEALFMQYLPDWFLVRDEEALTGWYTGMTNPYTARRLLAWLVPLAAWGAFILALLWVMLCLSVLVRKQWTQHERLSYPIILLPLEMTDDPARFIRQPLLWAGFAVSGGICILNGLHVLYPYLPYIPVKMRDISPNFTSPPWNAIGWTPISFYPFAIGLGFLMPADLLFSSWFFYFFFKAQRILSAYFGWSYDRPNFPYINEQCFGGYMGVAVLAIWGTRKHLARFFRAAWRADPNEWRDEPFSPRVAVVGLLVGMLLLVAFFWLSGLTLWVAVVAFLIYFAIAVACTRMRAELGPPAHDLHDGGPDYILTAALGTRFFSDRDLTILTYFYGFNRAYRSLAMPVQLEAFKMGERKAIPAGSIAFALVVASVGGLLSGYWALYHFGYTRGVEERMALHLSYFGWEAFNRLSSWLQNPHDADVSAVTAIGVGWGTVVGLQAVRMRFSWFPLHPIGLPIAGSWTMNTIWLPMVIAWAVKVTILRYGGLRVYRRTLAFFFGLILGDFLIGCFWPIIGWWLKVNTYSFTQ